MTEITFDEEELHYAQSLRADEEGADTPTLIRLLEKIGLQERQAYYTLIGICIVCVLLTFSIVFNKQLLPKQKTRPTYLEEIPLEVRNKLPADYFKDFPSRNDVQKTN